MSHTWKLNKLDDYKSKDLKVVDAQEFESKLRNKTQKDKLENTFQKKIDKLEAIHWKLKQDSKLKDSEDLVYPESDGIWIEEKREEKERESLSIENNGLTSQYR